MVTFNLAYTAPANPEGAAPVLTREQLFAGFRQKIRKPWLFVPAIETSEVLSDADGVVKRRVTFKSGPSGSAVAGHPKQVIEICTELAPSRVDYELENGSSVLNVISAGPSGEPDDLFVTYIFKWKHDDLEAGSDAAKEAELNHKKVAKMAVDSSIATTRKLVSEGAI